MKAVALGAGIAWAGIRLLQGIGAPYFPRTQEMALNAPVWWGLAACSGLIFGLVPAMQSTGGSLDASLRSPGRASTGNLAVRRLRRALVSAQFAIVALAACFVPARRAVGVHPATVLRND